MASKLINELSPHCHWLVYKKESVTKGKNKGGITKVPYQPNGYKARPTDPKTWTTYNNAKAAMETGKFDGIGYALTADEGYICIDLDHCVNPETGDIDQWAMEILDIVQKAGGTYSESSPSRTGIHLWGRGRLPDNKGINQPMKNGHKIEMYNHGHYMTVTGEPLDDATLNDIQPAIDKILTMLKKPPAASEEGKAVTSTPAPMLNLSDTDIITMIKENETQGPKFHSLYDLGDVSTYGNDQSRADQALLNMLAFWTGKNAEQMKRIFLSSKLAETLGRKVGHEDDYLKRSIKKAIESTSQVYDPKGYAAKKQAEELRAIKAEFGENFVLSFEGGEHMDDKTEVKTHDEQQKKSVTLIERIKNFKKNDSENADRLAALCEGKFLYCTDLKSWLKYDGKRWCRVESVELQEPARLAIKKELADMSAAYAIYMQGSGELDENLQGAYNSILSYLNGAAQNRVYIDNAIKLAAGKPAIMCKSTDFDNTPYLLNCANGVLNLKTFELMPHSPKQMFMKCTRAAYTPREHSSLWRDTMRQIVPDNDTYEYVQRMAGYCLTGNCSEELLFFLHGHGGTGKGTFTETLGYALGDYSTSVPVEILLSSKWEKGGNSPSPYIAGLKGTRLAFSSESGMGNYFDEATLKHLTGGDTITGRFLHSNPITFEPSHKLVISSNYMPAIHDATDDGVKRRLVIIPFNADIKKRDTTLKNRLHTPENLSDCLLWAVEGCRKWQATGLGEGTFPQEIKDTIKGYYDENDTLAQFVEANCKFGPNEEVSGKQLYKEFKEFADENEADEMTRRTFTQAMVKKYGAQIKNGFVHGGKDRGFKGIGLKYSPYEQTI